MYYIADTNVSHYAASATSPKGRLLRVCTVHHSTLNFWAILRAPIAHFTHCECTLRAYATYQVFSAEACDLGHTSCVKSSTVQHEACQFMRQLVITYAVQCTYASFMFPRIPTRIGRAAHLCTALHVSSMPLAP